MIGLCGAHRTGKTTLARAYAKKHGIQFLETSVSAIFKELGVDPAGTFDFKTRLDIQEVILKRLDAAYGSVPPNQQAITDRTPIDLLGYTMAEAIGEAVSVENQERFKRYVNNCFEVLNRRFSVVLLVQPGIPIVAEQGKAAANAAYIEHLNSLMFGLSVDERVACGHYFLRRSITDPDERLAVLERAVGKRQYAFQEQVREYQLEGGLLH